MMIQDSGSTQSMWLTSAEIPAENGTEATHLPICIIGAGVTGLSCAYRLAKQGKNVVVLDDGPPAGGETCRTTAHLASALDDRFTEIERLHGEDGSRLAHESHAAAITEIEAICRTENIQCEFQRVDGFLFPGSNFTPDDMEKEFEAARRAGFTDAEFPVESPIGRWSTKSGIRFPRQAQFDPVKYLAGVAEAIKRMGGQIVTEQIVQEVKEDGSKVTIVLGDGREITADQCIVATNAPIVSLEIQLKQAPYRTYAIALEIPRNNVPSSLFWDTEDPYHYVRLQHGSSGSEATDMLIVGGEDHKTGKDPNPERCFDRLETWTRERFPAAGEVKFKWSGQVMEPADGLAFIGLAPGMKNIFLCTGDSGMGITHGTIASIMLPDLMEDKDHPWARLYDPSRRILKSLPTMVKENLTAVPQLVALAMPGEVKSADDIPVDSGAVVREGLHKIAIYKDKDGHQHRLTAVCNHLGCEIEWNNLEKSWDCPCHGSRFSCEGKVLNGPASKPLHRA